MSSDVVYERTVMQLRAEYMDAAIGECATICNAVMSRDPGRLERLRQDAEEAGIKAQVAFEAFVNYVNDNRANKENEN